MESSCRAELMLKYPYCNEPTHRSDIYNQSLSTDKERWRDRERMCNIPSAVHTTHGGGGGGGGDEDEGIAGKLCVLVLFSLLRVGANPSFSLMYGAQGLLLVSRILDWASLVCF